MFLPSLLLLSRAVTTNLHWSNIKHVYAFGDSYSFVGGTHGRPGYSFMGDRLAPGLTPTQVLSNQIISGQSGSDGPIWLEYLTGCTNGPPASCTRSLWDLSFAGADIDANLLPLHHDYTIPLVEQVSQFQTYVLPFIAKGGPYETLVAWWIGINDTFDVLLNGYGTTYSNINDFWDAEMDSYFNAVNAINSQLTSACHLFLTVIPSQRAPLIRTDSAKVAAITTMIQAFNSRLVTRVNNLSYCAKVFDAYAWFNTVLDNPATYGFTDVTGTGSSANGFFWYDSTHPTTRVHQLLASAIQTALA